MPYADPEKRRVMAAHYSRLWRERHRDTYREQRKTFPSYSKLTRVDTHEAHAAHQAVHRALKRGELERPSACSLCGLSDSRIEAAHRDYARPLDIEWLCARCHRARDAVSPLGGTVPPDQKERRMRPRGSGPIHGTVTGYSYYLCRCELCRAAWAKNSVGSRARKAAAS